MDFFGQFSYPNKVSLEMIVKYLVSIFLLRTEVSKSSVIAPSSTVTDYCGQVCLRFSNATDPAQNLCGPSGSQCTNGLCTNLFLVTDEGGERGLINSEVEADLTDAEMAEPLTCFQAQQVLGSPRTIRGILDVENTCYINTALQLLFHMGPFRSFLASAAPTPFVQTVSRLMLDVDSGDEALEVSSLGIRDELQAHGYAGFETGALGDASEAITALINLLDAQEMGPSRTLASRFGIMNNVSMQCETCASERVRFHGPDLLLQARLVGQPSAISLAELLDESLHHVEQIDAHCDEGACVGLPRDLRTETRVVPFGDVLMISIGRVGNHGSRINTAVTFPTTLAHALLSHNYRLVGVANHNGRVAVGGHYYAELLHEGTWYRLDDLAVNPLPNPGATITSVDATLLIYERI